MVLQSRAESPRGQAEPCREPAAEHTRHSAPAGPATASRHHTGCAAATKGQSVNEMFLHRSGLAQSKDKPLLLTQLLRALAQA